MFTLTYDYFNMQHVNAEKYPSDLSKISKHSQEEKKIKKERLNTSIT